VELMVLTSEDRHQQGEFMSGFPVVPEHPSHGPKSPGVSPQYAQM
jgi:hypothetical protein